MSVGSLVSSGPLLLAIPVAAAAGAVTFLSPCVLPLVPGYLSYITGLSGAAATGGSGNAAEDGEGGPVAKPEPAPGGGAGGAAATAARAVAPAPPHATASRR